MTDTEEKKRGRKKGYRKPDSLNISKGVRFSEAGYARLTKAREITHESESDFLRDAVETKIQRVLKEPRRVAGKEGA